jgi:hypothetical protein
VQLEYGLAGCVNSGKVHSVTRLRWLITIQEQVDIDLVPRGARKRGKSIEK